MAILNGVLPLFFLVSGLHPAPVSTSPRACVFGPKDTTYISLSTAPSCRGGVDWSGEPAWEFQLPAEVGSDPGSIQTEAGRSVEGRQWFVILDQASHSIIRVSEKDGIQQKIRLDTVDGLGLAKPPMLLSNPPGDSVLVWDATREQIAILNPALALDRTVELKSVPLARRREARARFSGGEYLVHLVDLFSDDSGAGAVGSRVHFGHYDAERAMVDSILTTDGRRYDAVQGILVPIPLSTDPLWSVGGADTFVLHHGTDVLSHFRGSVRRETFLFTGLPDVSVTDELKASTLETEFGITDRTPAETLQAIRQLEFPEYAPHFDRLLADGKGGFWLRIFDAGRGDRQSWIVIDPRSEHAPACRVQIPDSYRLDHVTQDTLAGIWRDSEGGLHLRVYAVTKAP